MDYRVLIFGVFLFFTVVNAFSLKNGDYNLLYDNSEETKDNSLLIQNEENVKNKEKILEDIRLERILNDNQLSNEI